MKGIKYDENLKFFLNISIYIEKSIFLMVYSVYIESDGDI